VVLGPKRLAETSRSLGRTLRSFKEYKGEFKEGLLGTPGKSEPDEQRSGKERPPTKRAIEEEKANDKESRG
jgi:Sec-independent protein translocase protein TatA